MPKKPIDSKDLSSFSGVALLKKAQEKAAQTFEKVPVGLLHLNHTLEIIDSNLTFQNWLSYQAEALKDSSILKIIHPDDAIFETPEEFFGTAEGTLWNQKRFLKKDGSYIWGLIKSQAVREDENKFSYYISIEDISEFKKVQAELSKESNLANLYFKGLNQAAIVAITDRSGKIKYVNESFCLISGYSRSELLGQDHRILNSAYHGKDFFKKMWQKISSAETWRAEIRNKKKSGELYWVDTTILPMKNEHGEIYQYMSIRFEITQRKMAEENLGKTTMWLSSILDGAHYSIISTDPTGTILTINKAAQELLEYEASEIVHQHSPALFHDAQEIIERSKSLSQELGQIVEPGFKVFVSKALLQGSETLEWTYISKSQKRIPVRLCVSSIQDAQGELIGFLGIAENLSVQKALEAELEMQKAKMIASSKMSALGEMAAGVAHEINNPLTVIQGRSEQLMRSAEQGEMDADKFAKGLLRISQTAQRIARIIKALRTFSRNSEADPLDEVLLKTVIDDTLELCQERFKNHQIELRIHCDPTLKIRARSVQISQVLMNLLGNSFDALEALSEKWVEIVVTKNPNLSNLCIKFTDSGHGIPAALLDKIMNPFFTTKEPGRGTGLGLSISRNICREHGGDLVYKQNEAHTCFEITLPYKHEFG